MRFRVVLLEQAKADIEANARWWAINHSSEQAARWFWAIHAQLKTLANFPESHALSAENEAFPYEIRDKLVGLGSRPGYRAIFTIRGDTVHVLAVRSGAQAALEPGDVESPPAGSSH